MKRLWCRLVGHSWVIYGAPGPLAHKRCRCCRRVVFAPYDFEALVAADTEWQERLSAYSQAKTPPLREGRAPGKKAKKNR